MYFLNCCGTRLLEQDHEDNLTLLEKDYILYKVLYEQNETFHLGEMRKYLTFVVKGKNNYTLFFTKNGAKEDNVLLFEVQDTSIKSTRTRLVRTYTHFGLVETSYYGIPIPSTFEEYLQNYVGIFTPVQLDSLNVEAVYASLNPSSGNKLYFTKPKSTKTVSKDYIPEVFQLEKTKFIKYDYYNEYFLSMRISNTRYLNTVPVWEPFATNRKEKILEFLEEASMHNANYIIDELLEKVFQKRSLLWRKTTAEAKTDEYISIDFYTENNLCLKAMFYKK